jgi:hypothetical protein
MIWRGFRLTGMRRSLLSALLPGRGMAADALKRTVALSRSLSPDKAGWGSFNSSFTRALRLLEAAGALEIRREETLFRRACATWIRLTPKGESARSELVTKDEHGLGTLEPEDLVLSGLEARFARASDAELARIEGLVAKERTRRADLGAEACPRSTSAH